MHSDTGRESVTIVGGGMACHRLCQNLLKEGYAPGNITIFTDESIPPYDRANLSKYFQEQGCPPPLLNRHAWYEEQGIHLHLSQSVQSLDTEGRSLVLSDGNRKTFAQLVFCTGARVMTHEIEGVDQNHVFTYRNWTDFLKIQSFCRAGRKIAVIGGGLLGLEAADALHRAKCEVTVHEMANTLLCRNLNETAGSVLLEAMEALGIRVSLTSQLERIVSRKGLLELHFRGGDQALVEGVLLATGTRPSDALAAEAGVSVSPKGGILINEGLETNVPGIYAIGDCASFHHDSYGFVQPAYEQADILAARLCGSDQTYEPKGRSCRLNVVGIDVSAHGENLIEGEHLVYKKDSVFRCLVVARGKLMGATTIGPWDQTTALGVAVQENFRIPHRQKLAFRDSGQLQLLADMGGVTSWAGDAMVCQCTHMSCQAVKNAIAEGFDSLKSLESHTGAGGQCGSCRPLLLGLIRPGTEATPDAGLLHPGTGKRLKWMAVIGLIMCLFIWAPWNMPTPDSVQGFTYQWNQFWTDGVTKQVTGYTTAGLSLFSLILSLRKRCSWFRLGDYAFWKTMHASLGTLTLVGMLLHTGSSMGDNLNFWLAASFLSLNTLGALAAITAASQDASTHGVQSWFRVWLTRSHLIFFWPYPVLLGVHIFKVYQY